MKNIAVAIDGPAGAGKSTIAKNAAKNRGLVYIDTGAMYRTVALYALNSGINPETERDRLVLQLDNIDIDIDYDNGVQRMLLGGEDVSELIRTEKVGMGASAVAAIPEVRLMLVEIQRRLAESKSVIMDGRDIGTNVLPNADLKIFLTASADERAKRRYEELKSRGCDADFEKIKADIIQRDKNDSEREIAPLRRAEDAVLVDTTLLGIDEVTECIERLIEELNSEER